MKKVLFSLMMLSALFLSAAEGTLPFRYGKILSAESSSRKPSIASKKMKDTSDGIWVEIVIQLYPGRTIGSFDYELESNGVKYPCRAIAKNQESYDENVWEITDTSENDKFRLLFNPKKSSSGKYRLRTYRPNPVYPEFELIDKKGESFTPVENISDKGVMGEKKSASAEGKQDSENKAKQ